MLCKWNISDQFHNSRGKNEFIIMASSIFYNFTNNFLILFTYAKISLFEPQFRVI